MEKTINNDKKENKSYNENLTLVGRKNIHIEGIVEIISSSDSNIIIKLKDEVLVISGENIHISKLDVNTGILEAEGNFNNIKYGKSHNIFKRVFK